jgi:hypothetical protein
MFPAVIRSASAEGHAKREAESMRTRKMIMKAGGYEDSSS